jgi:hypothetical protein
MPDLNFREKIIDISKILKSWQHRKQTHITRQSPFKFKKIVLPNLLLNK